MHCRRIIRCLITLILFPICLMFPLVFTTGCGDEGDPVTDMVNGDNGTTTEPVTEDPVVDPPDPVDPPPDPVEPKVSFQDDIMPILAESCAFAGCHAAPGANGLNLSDYDNFKKGGNRGPAFTAGDGQGSLIVKYINGRMQPQMPIGGNPLNAEQIQLITDWIDEGAENN